MSGKYSNLNEVERLDPASMTEISMVANSSSDVNLGVTNVISACPPNIVDAEL